MYIIFIGADRTAPFFTPRTTPHSTPLNDNYIILIGANTNIGKH